MFSCFSKKQVEPPPPKPKIPRSEFGDPPLPTVELRALAHIVEKVVPASTPDRYHTLDRALREELAEPGVEIEAIAPYAKRQVSRTRKRAQTTICVTFRRPNGR